MKCPDMFYNRKLKIIEELTEIIRFLLHRRTHEDKPILTLATTNLNKIIMNTTLTLGLNAISTLILVDNKTLQPITVTFTDQTVTSDAPSVATFAIDSTVPTQVNATPVAVGTGNIALSATASYTDSNTGQPVTQVFTATYPFSVTAEAEGLTLSLTDFVNVPATV